MSSRYHSSDIVDTFYHWSSRKYIPAFWAMRNNIMHHQLQILYSPSVITVSTEKPRMMVPRSFIAQNASTESCRFTTRIRCIPTGSRLRLQREDVSTCLGIENSNASYSWYQFRHQLANRNIRNTYITKKNPLRPKYWECMYIIRNPLRPKYWGCKYIIRNCR